MNPYQSLPTSKRMMTLVGIYLAIVGNLMVSNTNATLLPTAAAEIGGQDIYGLAQSISGVLSVCLMPIFGFVAAKSPHMKPMLTGGGLLVGAGVLLVRALAPSMVVIIFANVFWGFVSAAVFVVGFTTIRDMFEPEQAGVYLGLVSSMMSLGMLAGPFLGGMVIDRLGWRVLCFMLAAILLLAAALNLLGARISKEEGAAISATGAPFDWTGGISITIFLACLIVVLSLGTSYLPFGGMVSNVLIVVAVIAVAVVASDVRRKGDAAIVPASALKDRSVLVLAACNLLHNFGSMTVTFFIPSFIMVALAADPLVVSLGAATSAGIATSLVAVLGIFLGPVFGKLIAKRGDCKQIMVVGNVVRLIVTTGFVFLLVPTTPVWVIYLLMFAVGFYNSQISTTMSVAPQIQLAPHLRVTGNSVVQLGQNFGASIGVALFTLVIAANPAGGMITCMVIALVAYAVMFVLTLLLKSPEHASA